MFFIQYKTVHTRGSLEFWYCIFSTTVMTFITFNDQSIANLTWPQEATFAELDTFTLWASMCDVHALMTWIMDLRQPPFQLHYGIFKGKN
jgi:hypothetical protein